ncbi:hypothetical protein SCHPADRAFT_942967 [Schizopora paradoxa]|uniref:Uncharacterized protein n=1 Tax=Schizopora paradoxa TaxID=27342 RepID=A0A0H2REL4_9AGAM|nr:hypothetical protein SCHPADRAFT_942967 [Schizopora paradoxa]
MDEYQFFTLAKSFDIAAFAQHFSYFLEELFSPPGSLGQSGWTGDYEDCERLGKLLSYITKSPDYRERLSWVDQLNDRARCYLKDTIFADKVAFTYCVLICHTVEVSETDDNVMRIDTLVDMCSPLISFAKSDCPKDHSTAISLAARFCAFNRYFKLAALQAAEEGNGHEVYYTASLIPTDIASLGQEFENTLEKHSCGTAGAAGENIKMILV